ncbi:MAG TPA: cellulose binding domain-containing protein [Pirellulales bacterium]
MSRRSAWQNWLQRASQPRRRMKRSRSLFQTGTRLGCEALEDRRLLTASTMASYTLTQDWGSGFQAQIQLTNPQSTSVPNWQLQFDFSRNITSIWDAKIVSHTGNHYVIAGASYDSTLSANSNLTFGFIGSGSGAGVTPANYVINGVTSGNPLPGLSVSDVSQAEGNSGTTNFLFNVTLSAASTAPVTVKYATANGTATAGSDYTATSGTLTFAAGQTTKQVAVPVIGDTTPESNETFSLVLSSPTGATLTRATATGTILNDDTSPSTGSFHFQLTSDWGSGFSGQITATNSSQQTISNWQMEFDFPISITSIWDATIVSHVGNHYVVQNAGWNSTIAPGGAISFGFNGGPGNLTVAPTNYLLHGATSGTTGGTNHPPTPVADSVLVNVNQATPISVLANDTDPDGDPLSLTAVTQAAHGTTLINSNGTVTYTPATGYTGSDAFSYTVSDGRGGTASANVAITVGTPAATTTWPAQFYAPYVDVTLYPTYNLVSTTQSQGIKYYTLAFITADANNQPAWGGYSEYEVNGGAFDMALRQQVASVRSLGGDVMASFGGEAGQELAQVITDVGKLTAAYQTVITDYNLTYIDFDIEGAAVADHASIDRRSQALAALEQTAAAAGHTLSIWYTLPVLPTGLTADGLYVLQSALKYGVKIGGVNVMTMDYGDSPAPNPQGHMGDYAIDAANSVFTQLQGLYGSAKTSAQLWQMIGVTPMIGVNDQTDEVFDEAAAQELVTFAQQKGMARISMWSLNRDTQGTAKSYVDNTSSSITQQAFDFSKIFEKI